MNKVELDAINSIVNSDLQTIEEKSGIERIREIEKPKVGKGETKVTSDADRRKANLERERESSKTSIQTSEAKSTINSLMEFLRELSTITSEKTNGKSQADRLHKILMKGVKSNRVTPQAIEEMKKFINAYETANNLKAQQQDNQNGTERN